MPDTDQAAVAAIQRAARAMCALDDDADWDLAEKDADWDVDAWVTDEDKDHFRRLARAALDAAGFEVRPKVEPHPEVQEMAQEQGRRCPSKGAAWLHGWKEGQQHARLHGQVSRPKAEPETVTQWRLVGVEHEGTPHLNEWMSPGLFEYSWYDDLASVQGLLFETSQNTPDFADYYTEVYIERSELTPEHRSEPVRVEVGPSEEAKGS